MSREFTSDPRLRLREARDEAVHFRARAIAGFVLIVVCLVGLGTRFAYLQTSRHDEFTARSDQNRISVRSIAPTRGLIYDRNGVLLADNIAGNIIGTGLGTLFRFWSYRKWVFTEISAAPATTVAAGHVPALADAHIPAQPNASAEPDAVQLARRTSPRSAPGS